MVGWSDQYEDEVIPKDGCNIYRVTKKFGPHPDWQYDFRIPPRGKKQLVFTDYRRLDEQAEDGTSVNPSSLSAAEAFSESSFRWVCRDIILHMDGGEILDENGETIMALEWYGVDHE